MEFKSHVATSIEQSKRLLELGLKKETADCQYAALIMDWKGDPISNPKWRFYDHNKGFIVQNFEQMECIPAWSLFRLIKLCEPIPVSYDWLYRTDDYYENMIACIAWRISKESFNPQFLEEKQ